VLDLSFVEVTKGLLRWQSLCRGDKNCYWVGCEQPFARLSRGGASRYRARWGGLLTTRPCSKAL